MGERQNPAMGAIQPWGGSLRGRPPRLVWIGGWRPSVSILRREVGDVGLDDAGLAAEVVPTWSRIWAWTRARAVGVEHEVAWQVELGRAGLDDPVAAPDLVRVLSSELGSSKRSTVWSSVSPPRATQGRRMQGHDLVRLNGLVTWSSPPTMSI